jgi:hypothetical protein
MLIRMRSAMTSNVSERSINITIEEYDRIMAGNEPVEFIVPHLSIIDVNFLQTGLSEREQMLLKEALTP